MPEMQRVERMNIPVDTMMEVSAKYIYDRGFAYWLVSVQRGNQIIGKKIMVGGVEHD